MDIGALRNRLDLQSPTDTVDAAGQPTRTWGTYATVWGSITPTKSNTKRSKFDALEISIEGLLVL